MTQDTTTDPWAGHPDTPWNLDGYALDDAICDEIDRARHHRDGHERLERLLTAIRARRYDKKESMTDNDVRTIQKRIGAMNEAKGFHGSHEVPDEFMPLYISSKLLLISSEAVEAQDELRAGRRWDEDYTKVGTDDSGLMQKPEGFASELADVIIRALDLADELGLDMQDTIELKLRYNETRAFKHGKRF